MKLCRLCVEEDRAFDELFDSCARLMPYGVQVRYPNHTELYEEDMRIALKDSKKVMDMLEPKLQLVLEEMKEIKILEANKSQNINSMDIN